jgi:putative toxin-antitoxin system antitoxin component (TIGR02293 family)
MRKALDRSPEGDFAGVPGALMAHALDTFGNDRKAKSWLVTPNPALDNRPPIGLVDTAEGVREVDEVLTRIDYGMFS